MASERTPIDISTRQSFAVSRDQALIGVEFERDGEVMVRYFTDEAAADAARSTNAVDAALEAIGSFSDLDWDDMVDTLDRIRHDSPPSPPVDLEL